MKIESPKMSNFSWYIAMFDSTLKTVIFIHFVQVSEVSIEVIPCRIRYNGSESG